MDYPMNRGRTAVGRLTNWDKGPVSQPKVQQFNEVTV
jgi:hypothetical protein